MAGGTTNSDTEQARREWDALAAQVYLPLAKVKWADAYAEHLLAAAEERDAPPVMCFPYFHQMVKWVQGAEDVLDTTKIMPTRIEYERIGHSPDRNPASVGYRYRGVF